MNKKGFTLIELLGVIVILALIALITTPIVMNVIEDSRKSAAARSAENYTNAVETAMMQAKLNGIQLEEKYYIVDEGNLCPDGINCADNPDKVVKINVNGNKPSRGSIFVENGLVKDNSAIIIDDYTLSYNSDQQTYVALAQPICTYVSETGTQEGAIGAKYTCHLDGDRTFYVLENNEFSENISLIMDSNFSDYPNVKKVTAWCIDGGNDNTTCQNINSKEEGTPLKYIEDTFGNNVVVSLPTVSQVTTASGIQFNWIAVTGLKDWLCVNLESGYNKFSSAYWTASPNPNDTTRVAHVNYNGALGQGRVYTSDYDGIRPVITISKVLLG